MQKHTLAIVLGLAAVLGVGLAAARWLHVIAAPRANPRRIAARQGEVVRFASNAIPAPPFLLPDLDGNIVSTAGWHGKVVLLNFWATWCPPCREEIPELVDLASRYKDQLQIVGVSMDDEAPQQVRMFAKRFGINYSVVMASPEMVDEYGGVPALPTSFIINREGRIVQKHVGLYPIEVYETEVRALLGLPVDARVEMFQDTGQIFLKNAALATELPGVDFRGLNDKQKKEVLKRLNSETCSCGCRLTLAQCRINDTACPISRQLANQIVKEVRAGTPASTPAAANPNTNR
jgi:thiol-disulfide isomerase/thioredoxin